MLGLVWFVLTISHVFALDLQGKMGDSGNNKLDIMSTKEHGTCPHGILSETLRWGCDVKLADRISCFNRHYAEHSRYFVEISNFMEDLVINRIIWIRSMSIKL